MPIDTVATLHFANVGGCGEATDKTVTFGFGPATNASDSDGITSIALTTVPGNILLDFNQAPSAIALVPTAVPPVVSGWTGATFTTSDPDAGNTFVYTLVSGAGEADNTSFIIVGDKLNAAAPLVPATTYHIRVRSTDQGGLYVENEIVVTVGEQATLTIGADTSDADGVARKGSTVGALKLPIAYDAESNIATSLIFRVSYSDQCLVVTGNGTPSDSDTGWLEYTFSNPASNATLAELTVTAKTSCPDNNGGSPNTPAMRQDVPLTLQIVEFKNDTLNLSMGTTNGSATVIDNSRSGNCNADVGDSVNAADYVATVLESFDATTGSTWLHAPLSGFDGSPFGCDSTQDAEITVNDIPCTVNISFDNETAPACTSAGRHRPRLHHNGRPCHCGGPGG